MTFLIENLKHWRSRRKKKIIFLISSSIIKHLARDRTFPQDYSIHAYPGSMTKEKLQLLQGYDQEKMKTVILQDGTNAILKQKSDHLETLISDYKDLVSALKEKFSPETLVLMEVPPLKKLPKNEQTNNKIYEFNEKLREYITQENTEKIEILPVCNMLRKWQITTLSFTMIYILIFSREFRSLKMQF